MAREETKRRGEDDDRFREGSGVKTSGLKDGDVEMLEMVEKKRGVSRQGRSRFLAAVDNAAFTRSWVELEDEKCADVNPDKGRERDLE